MNWRLILTLLLISVVFWGGVILVNVMRSDDTDSRPAGTIAHNPSCATTTPIWEHGQPSSLGWSADGRLLSIQANGTLWLYNAADVTASPRQLTDVVSIDQFAFSPVNFQLATADSDGVIYFWDVATRTSGSEHPTEQGAVLQMRFSLDGAYLAYISEDGTMSLRDMAAQQVIATVHEKQVTPIGLSFRPGGSQLVVHSVAEAADTLALNQLFLIDTATGEVSKRDLFEGATISDLAFSPDGEWLVGVAGRDEVVFWDAETFERSGAFSFEEADTFIATTTFSPNGHTLMMAQSNNAPEPFTRVVQLNVAIGKVVGMATYDTVITDMAVSPDDRQLALMGEDGCIYRWDRRGGRALPEIDHFVNGFPES